MTISSATWEGLIIGLALLVFAVPAVAGWVGRADDDPAIFRMAMASGALKLAAAPLWIYVIDHSYGGIADAWTYNRVGGQVAAQIRHGDFHFHVGGIVGDGATSIITGVVYAVIGPNTLGGFFLFSFLAFCSLVLFYRAFRTALPEADHLRYAKLVFFLPSLLFWTSAIGKDALISFGLGLAAFGGARILAGQRGGFPLTATGLALAALIRPHVALMLFAGLAVAYLLGKSTRRSPLSPITRVFGVVILFAGGLALANVTAHFLGLQSLDPSSVQHVLQQNALNTGSAAQTQIGQFGSSAGASYSLSPLAIPRDVYYVLVRPLPFQAHGLPQLATSLESLFLVALFIASWRRVAAALAAMRRHPYLLVAALYSLVWIVLFASIGNLGILARERTSLYPLLVVLVSWKAPGGREAAPAAPGLPGAESMAVAGARRR